MALKAPAVPPTTIGTEQKNTIFTSESPLLMKGPVDISPLNMATTRPVALISTVSIELNASITGVKRTPPPIPATTATMAIKVLNRKEPKTISHISVGVKTAVPDTFEKIPIVT
jgi:hypothetical protein